MRTKSIFLTLIAALLTLAASAQNELLREVEVTRAYEPSVQNFLKLGIMPDMTDTTQMRPEFNYEITPRPLVYGFSINPLQPARFNTVENRELFPGYLKVGIGYPLQSVVDFRYAKPLSDRTDFGAYANHYGQYGKLKNDMEVKENAFQTYNRVGLFADHRMSNDLVLNAELGYDFTQVTRYGYYDNGQGLPQWFDTSKEALKQFFHQAKADVAFGHSFTDLNKFNFRLRAGADYFADRFKYDQFEWHAGLLFGFGLGYDGFLQLRANYSATEGMKNYRDYSNQILTAGAQYDFDNGEFRFSLGADYGYDKIEEGKSTLLPQFKLEFDLAGGEITPFVDVRSEIVNNSYGNLARRNPYLSSGQDTLNTKSYQGLAGIKGVLGSSFKYKLYGGYQMLEETYYWSNYYYNTFSGERPLAGEGNIFTLFADNLDIAQAGLEVEVNVVDALTLFGSFNYYHYSSEKYENPGGLPDFKSNLGVTYNHRNQLYLTAGATLLGERQMFETDYYSNSTNTISPTVDLRLSIDYFINKRFGVFVSLNNLLNQELYEFNRYRMLGVNGHAGVKLTF